MANVLDLGNVTLAVGQKVQFVLTVQSSAPASVWLVSASTAVVKPVAADGTPLTWPHEVTLSSGVGTYFLLGVSTGAADYFVRANSDPNNTTNIMRASITVTPPPAQGHSPGEEIIIEVTSIAEPILISIIVQSPSNTSSD